MGFASAVVLISRTESWSTRRLATAVFLVGAVILVGAVAYLTTTPLFLDVRAAELTLRVAGPFAGGVLGAAVLADHHRR